MKKNNNQKKSAKDRPHEKEMARQAPFLVANGIRPTRQRIGLSSLLFDGRHHHVTAEELMSVAKKKKVRISLATVYNSLHEFVRRGILQEIVSDGHCRYFDTNLDNHSHFFDEKSCRLWDIGADRISVSLRQDPPKGMVVDRIRTAVYLKKAD